MFIVTTCRGKKAAFVPQDISCFAERGGSSGHLHVYVRGDTEPFAVDCTFEEFLEMYETALSCTTPGHISSIRAVPQPVIGPPSTETPEQRAHRLGQLEKFQQDLRAMFPEAYVFVMEPDGAWLYNTATSVVSAFGQGWNAYGEKDFYAWKTVDLEICEEWREELKWLPWQASMFYGQAHELAPDTFEPFVGRGL